MSRNNAIEHLAYAEALVNQVKQTPGELSAVAMASLAQAEATIAIAQMLLNEANTGDRIPEVRIVPTDPEKGIRKCRVCGSEIVQSAVLSEWVHTLGRHTNHRAEPEEMS